VGQDIDEPLIASSLLCAEVSNDTKTERDLQLYANKKAPANFNMQVLNFQLPLLGRK